MRRESGYTLLEMLLYISILSILLVPLVAFLGLSMQARIKTQTIVEVSDQGSATLQQISQIVRNSTAITSPAVGVTGTSLTVTNLDGTSSLFSVVSGVLYLTVGSGAAVALTGPETVVSGVSFVNVSHSGTDGIVRVTMTLARNNPSGRQEYAFSKTYTTSVGAR